jgi:hypothetical protein
MRLTGTASTLTHEPWRPARRVRRRMRPWAGLMLARLFTLPHVLIGFGLIGAFVGGVIWLLAGNDFAAQVDRAWTTANNRGRPVYHVACTYDLNGRPRHLQCTIGKDTYNALTRTQAAPHTARVHTLSIGPVILFHKVIDTTASAWAGVGMIGLFGTFWCGVCLLMVREFYLRLWRVRRLYRIGLPATGTILSKRKTSGRGATHFLTVAFQTADGFNVRTETRTDLLAPWQRARKMDPIAILYDPRRPTHCVAPEFGLYRVDSA